MKKIFVCTAAFLLSFNSLKSQWIPVGEGTALGGDIMALLEYNNILYAGGTAYLFRSTDEGITWSGHFSQFAFAWSLTQSNGKIYCGLSYTPQTPGVYKSTDNGLNWVLTSLSNKAIISMASDNSQVLASADRIYQSTNEGQTWNAISNGLTGYLAKSGSRIYCGMSGLWVTSDNGVNWNLINNNAGISVVAEDSLVLFGTQNGEIYRSTDYGQNWLKVFDYPGAYVYCMHKYQQYVFAGTDSGFFVSTNSGESFYNKNENLGQSRIQSIMVHNDFIYAANGNYFAVPVSVWKRPLQEVINVEINLYELPDYYSLEQNYPNPFNGMTMIKYRIPQRSYVTLKVFDLLGREITTLVNSLEDAGEKSVNFNAGNLASGIYYYKLESEATAQIKKMVLIK